jgi:hypothetical protein
MGVAKKRTKVQPKLQGSLKKGDPSVDLLVKNDINGTISEKNYIYGPVKAPVAPAKTQQPCRDEQKTGPPPKKCDCPQLVCLRHYDWPSVVDPACVPRSFMK